ncbi:hypothetical protein CQW44_13695 [Streptomyces griseofuscus]|uniref:Uncharacterized protein n=1 Tax=Streptomyces griseofuscus TaxID=146922 RepID=A0A426S7F6_9ACTN|nr:hypothetical protein CQW44_13695 [Streptomyces griseofuscus]
MCRRITRPTCGKATYAGCRNHVEQVLAGVPRARRCGCPPAPKRFCCPSPAAEHRSRSPWCHRTRRHPRPGAPPSDRRPPPCPATPPRLAAQRLRHLPLLARQRPHGVLRSARGPRWITERHAPR